MRRSVSAVNPESPAIKALADALEAAFPSVFLETTNNETPGTRHTSGLAIDIMLDVTNTSQRQTAHAIIDVLVSRHAKRGSDGLPSLFWSDLIYSDYNGKGISYFHIPGFTGADGYGGKLLQRNLYTEDTKHGDHIHVDWVNFNKDFKNPPPEWSHIPYKWSDAAKHDEFRDTLKADFEGVAKRIGPLTSNPAVPGWLLGWWEVDWSGDKYYYFFDRIGGAQYTKVHPGKSSQPPVSPQDRGNFTISGSNVTIRWNITGSVEKFVGDPTHMSGVWNESDTLSATKL